MSTATISGKVVNAAGQAIPNAKVHMISDLATLGGMPGATAMVAPNYRWTRLVTGFSGDRWHAYLKFMAPVTVGLSFGEFKELIVEYNPSLVETGYRFQAERAYLLPKLRDEEVLITWDRTLTGFQGNRWQCWQQYVAGKVPGLAWIHFKTQIANQNPALIADNWHFHPDKVYYLPRNAQQRDYEFLVTTGRVGRFRIKDLPTGTYRVEVYAPGFLPHIQEITLEQNISLPPCTLPERIAAEVTERPNFVAVRPGSISFWLNGAQMRRFTGLNMTLLPHYGKTYRETDGQIKKVLEHSELHHRNDYLDRAQAMNVKVIRCFLPHYGVSNEEIATRFAEILAMAQARDLYVLPALIDLYHNRGAYPDTIDPNDESVYKQQSGFARLTTNFFEHSHETLFMPFVEFIVKKFRHHELSSRIFAWEIGNELKWDDRPDDFIDFMLKLAGQIKALDTTHMVTTGMKSTQHAYMFEKPTLAKRLYGSDLIDFVTIHSYVEPRAQDNQRIEEQRIEAKGIEDDAKLARELGKPLLIEEAGIVKAMPDAEQAFINHLAHWFDKQNDQDHNHQAYGYIQWGFDPEAIGDGDSKLWWDRDKAPTLYKQRADQLTPI